jgi:hypothetical protein
MINALQIIISVYVVTKILSRNADVSMFTAARVILLARNYAAEQIISINVDASKKLLYFANKQTILFVSVKKLVLKSVRLAENMTVYALWEKKIAVVYIARANVYLKI